MEQLIKADEAALAPFIKRINECIELYAYGRNSGVKIGPDCFIPCFMQQLN